MDLPCSLDGSGLWKFHRGTSAITGAGGKVEERVSIGQGEAFALLIVNLTCSLDARLRFQNLCQIFLEWTLAIRAAGKRWRIRGQNQGPAVSYVEICECGFNLYMCVCVWLRRSKTIKNVPAAKNIRMKKLGDKVTNSWIYHVVLMDLDYGSSIVEPAQSQELEEKLEKESLLAKARHFLCL